MKRKNLDQINSCADTRGKYNENNYFRGLKIRSEEEEAEDSDAFRLEPILGNFLRAGLDTRGEDDVDTLEAAYLAAWAARVSPWTAEDADVWAAADVATWAVGDVTTWAAADIVAWAVGDISTWAAEDMDPWAADDVDAWSVKVAVPLLFRRSERTFRPLPRSGDE